MSFLFLLIPIVGGYQLALHLFFMGWLSLYPHFSKKSLILTLTGIAGLVALSFIHEPLPFLSLLDVCFLMIGLVTSCYGLPLWLVGEMGYFFLRTARDWASNVTLIQMFLTWITIGLTPSFCRYFMERDVRPFSLIRNKFKTMGDKIKHPYLSCWDPLEAYWSVVILWIMCAAGPIKVMHSVLPLRYKNVLLLLNGLGLPFLGQSLGWFCFAVMIGINCALGVRTGGLALCMAGAAWIMVRYWPKKFLLFMSFGLVLAGIWSIYGVDLLINSSWLVALGKHDHSFYERLVVWKKVSGIARENFWFGMGPASLFQALKRPLEYFYRGKVFAVSIVHPHNVFLEIRASFGSVGLALFVGSIIASVYQAQHKWKEHTDFFALGMSGLVYLLVLWSGYLSFFKDPWIVAWGALVWVWACRFVRPFSCLPQ